MGDNNWSLAITPRYFTDSIHNKHKTENLRMPLRSVEVGARSCITTTQIVSHQKIGELGSEFFFCSRRWYLCKILITRLTIGDDLPPLVVTLCPLPVNDGSSIMDTTVIFVTMECIKVQANVVSHPYCFIVLTRVLALRP